MVSSCDAREASNTVQDASPATLAKFGLQVTARKLAQDVQTPSTVLVWTNGAWSGHAVSCKTISASIEKSRDRDAESGPKETLDHRWKQDENPETHRAAVYMAAGGAKDTVPDTIDSLGKEVKYAKKSKEHFPRTRKALEPSTRDCSRKKETCRRGNSSSQACVGRSWVAKKRASPDGTLRSGLRVRRGTRAISTRKFWKGRRC